MLFPGSAFALSSAAHPSPNLYYTETQLKHPGNLYFLLPSSQPSSVTTEVPALISTDQAEDLLKDFPSLPLRVSPKRQVTFCLWLTKTRCRPSGGAQLQRSGQRPFRKKQPHTFPQGAAAAVGPVSSAPRPQTETPPAPAVRSAQRAPPQVRPGKPLCPSLPTAAPHTPHTSPEGTAGLRPAPQQLPGAAGPALSSPAASLPRRAGPRAGAALPGEPSGAQPPALGGAGRRGRNLVFGGVCGTT